MAEADLNDTLDSLLDSLDDVEEALEPVLSKSLQDSLAECTSPVERAKLLFWLAYTIHSLTWVYTKTTATDPEDHGVLEEMNRIKHYNGKITAAAKKAADATTTGTASGSDTEKRRMQLDKEAASRFIKAGIANQPNKPSSESSFYKANASVSDPLSGPGAHSRLSSLARASNPKQAADVDISSSSSDSEEELKIYSEVVAAPPAASTSKAPIPTQQETRKVESSSEKEKDGDVITESEKQKKRREKKRKRQESTFDKPAVSAAKLDPLSGYDDATKKSKPSKDKHSEAEDSPASSAAPDQTESSTTTSTSKKSRKKNNR